MQQIRLVGLAVAGMVILAACGSSGGGSGTATPGAGAASQAAEPSTPDDAASPAESADDGGNGGDGGGDGGGLSTANGTITFSVSGGYSASGELAFVPLALSVFDESQGGWVAYFAAPDGGATLIQLNTSSNSIINFADDTMNIIGTEASGCTFTFGRNDPTGLSGSVECKSTPGFKIADSSPITADLTASWDAHP